MEQLLAFNQEGTLTDYCDTFQRLFDQVRNAEEISEFYGIYLFICGLEPVIREIFVDWHQYSCIKVEDVISLALKIDSNGLQDSFSPFDSNSSFYNKDLEFDVNITLEELMKNNEFFKNGMIQENIIDEVIDDTDSIDESENINSAYKVFDVMPEPIRDEIRIEIEAEFNDISICEIILSEMPEQHSVIQEINEYKNDNTSIVNHDVVLNASSDLNIWHYKNEIGVVGPVGSFGDIEFCVCNFWGQKSLKEGALGTIRMDTGSFGWKPGWISFERNSNEVQAVLSLVVRNGSIGCDVTDGCVSGWAKLQTKHSAHSMDFAEQLVIIMEIGTFGWKPGWRHYSDDVEVTPESVNELQIVKGIEEVGDDIASIVKSIGLLSKNDMVKGMFVVMEDLSLIDKEEDVMKVAMRVNSDSVEKIKSESSIRWCVLEAAKNKDNSVSVKMERFYELLEMDSHIGAKELDLQFMKGDQPHCGFPENFELNVETLSCKDYRLLVIEKKETPEQFDKRHKLHDAKDKVVKHKICAVITKGTLAGEEMMSAHPHAFHLFTISECYDASGNEQNDIIYGV